jgi:hypothetical protein
LQIKELTDPDLRRGKMDKDSYASIKAAKSLDQVSLIGDVRDVPPIANMHEPVLNQDQSIRRETHKNSFGETHNLLVRGSNPCGALSIDDLAQLYF